VRPLGRDRTARAAQARAARFERLFADHYASVRAYAVRRGAGDLAQDVAADVFAVAWRRLDDVPEDARAWLLAVARKTLANHRRGRRRADALVRRIEAVAGTHCAEAEGDNSVDVLEALASLSEGDQEILMLIAWDGLEPREVARVVGRSAATTRVRIHRAKKRLAAAIAERDATPASAPSPAQRQEAR
jgi:RNA polymerase sigma-70 factor (ECF subfamily)